MTALTDAFANVCESQAGWRQLTAEEYPADLGNQRSADALQSLADWTRENVAEAQVALGDLPPSLTSTNLDFLPFGDEAGRLLWRYGFDSTEEPRAFLAELVRAAYQDDMVFLESGTHRLSVLRGAASG